MSRLALYMFYLRAKFGDSRFSHFGDKMRASKLKMSHVIMTMPLLGVVCHP